MNEAELRDLAGVPPEPEVRFLGQAWKIRDDGLAPLIRYILATRSDNPEEPVSLSAVHRLLEDCVIDFSAFSNAAIDGRAGLSDLLPVVDGLVRFYCCRNPWPALRLLGYVAGSLDELDGQLIRAGGRGLAQLSAREACNVALAACLDGRNEEDRDIFLEDLNYEGSPEAEALAQLRAMQRLQKREVMDGGRDDRLE